MYTHRKIIIEHAFLHEPVCLNTNCLYFIWNILKGFSTFQHTFIGAIHYKKCVKWKPTIHLEYKYTLFLITETWNHCLLNSNFITHLRGKSRNYALIILFTVCLSKLMTVLFKSCNEKIVCTNIFNSSKY